jgi:lysozyme family protein
VSFEKAMEFLLKWEGGYVNDPRDPGGETKYGISKRSHPNVDIANLTVEQATAIYKRDYWDALNLDALPPCFGIAVFDAAVNCGKAKAALWKVRKGGWREVVIARMNHYVALGKHAKYKPFLLGWLNRLVDLGEFLHGEEAKQ